MAVARPADAGRPGMLGLFDDPDAVADALDGLRAAGCPEESFTVLSDTPYPRGAFGEREAHHHFYLYPTIGAVCGFAVGLLVTMGTQLAYPMVTGGKPILSIPPMLTVIYSASLLGAIVVTFFGILIESRLPDFNPTPYDARITEGYLGVLVTEPPDGVERVLRSAGAVDVIAGAQGARDAS